MIMIVIIIIMIIIIMIIIIMIIIMILQIQEYLRVARKKLKVAEKPAEKSSSEGVGLNINPSFIDIRR